MRLTLPSIVISSTAISTKRLGVFLSQPERQDARKRKVFITSSGTLNFIGKSIFGSLCSRVVDREGDFLREELSFELGSEVMFVTNGHLLDL